LDYILLNLFSGEVVDYQIGLIEELAAHFKLARIKKLGAPPHFTLKYWFNTDNIDPLIEDLEKFCDQHDPTPVKVGGFASFGKEVIYLKVEPSEEAMKVYENLLILLRQYDWIEWDRFDYPNLIFHATIAIECGERYEEIWKYLEKREKVFATRFDNITVLTLLEGDRASGKIDTYKTISMR